MQVEPGSKIAGRYKVVKRIGAGGMGMVFQAIDNELNDAVVALKLLLPHLASDEQIFKRFLNEVLVARSLSHPNIVRLHDIGKAEGGYYYISMELVDGYSLKERITTEEEAEKNSSTQFNFRPLTFNEALQILVDIASGVSYAHSKGVIHRDLKPGNVLISKRGDVKLADFGTARIMGMDTSLTQTGQVIGTPDYMSPEQIRGEALDSACDIYSLGIIGYELVTGCRPYVADSAVAVAFKHLSEPLPPFGEKLKHIPSWYRDLIDKATAKDRKARFQNGREFLTELQKHLPKDIIGEPFLGGNFSSALETGKFELGEKKEGPVSGTEWQLGEPGTPTSTGPNTKKSPNSTWILALVILTALFGYGFFRFRDRLIPIDKLPNSTNPELAADEIAKQLENLDSSRGVQGSSSEEKVRSSVSQSSLQASSTSSSTESVAVSSAKSEVPVITASPTPLPTATPTQAPTLEPSPTPTPKPKIVSAGVRVKIDEQNTQEIPADGLGKARWEISVTGLTAAETEGLQINLINTERGNVVSKLRAAHVSSRGEKLSLQGRFEGVARALPPDSYRIDVLRSGDLLASSRFSVYVSETPVPTQVPDVSQPETTDSSQPAQPGEAQAVSKNFLGTIELTADDGAQSRALSLSLTFQGLEISGTASIQGFGDLTVSGKELVRGYDISLRGEAIQLRLTSGKGTTSLRGSYVVAGKPIRGSWQVKLVP